jgi:hypothetical protein
MSVEKKSELEQRHLSDSDDVCGSCGVAAIDDVKLKLCDGGCDLVKYCSDECLELHREQHEEDCKKRKTELRDKTLFTQPDSSYKGECPLCFLPLSIDGRKSTMMTCCCKMICNGCNYANVMREREQGLEPRCAFCRNPAPKSEEEIRRNVMKRIKKNNDPVGMTQMGRRSRQKGDYGKALEYFEKATELGDVDAQFNLGILYYDGNGVEKDMKKAVYHWEQAAIGGHPDARSRLGLYEAENGSIERAVKHFIISANLGCDGSLKIIKDFFVKGVVSKEDYAAALRGYQAAVDATKSAEREKAEVFYGRLGNFI